MTTLVDVTRALLGDGRITVPDGGRQVVATLSYVDTRGRVPVLVARTDDDREVVVPLDNQPGGAQ